MSTQTLVLRHGKSEQRIFFSAADAIPPLEFLSPSETEQAAGFQFAAKKQGFLLGRLAAKRALGALLEEPDLRRIEIRSGIYGQPLVQHLRAECPMGIDLETISAASAEVVLGELEASPPELTWLATGGVDPATACCVLWTAREALGKSFKLGLNSPLGILALSEIRPEGEDTWACRYVNFPRCQCLSQAKDGRVLSLAMPADASLGGKLQWRED